ESRVPQDRRQPPGRPRQSPQRAAGLNRPSAIARHPARKHSLGRNDSGGRLVRSKGGSGPSVLPAEPTLYGGDFSESEAMPPLTVLPRPRPRWSALSADDHSSRAQPRQESLRQHGG